jgi:glycosyltransferase involved in cell wall biosynthesis
VIDVIAVGNLIPLKQFDYYIKLLSKLQQKAAKFVLIGGGPEEKNIRELIQQYQLEDSIELKGILNHEETLTLIAQSKVLVHPSEFEGFGMVIIEALLHKTAVLSSPVGISYQNESTFDLTFDLDRDALQLARLLDLKEIESVHYDIQETVTNYINHYESSLRSVKNYR